MIKVFIDANFFVSLLKEDDVNHQKANSILLAYEKKATVFFTSFYIVDETATVLSMRVSKKRASEFLQDAEGLHFPVILPVTETLREETYQFFQTVKDKDISMIDCYSAMLMKEHGISTCLTFDKQFKKKGFQIC